MIRRTALAAGLVVLTACGGARPSAPTPADIAAIDVSPDHTIAVDDHGYTPAALQVRAGEVVRLVNKGAHAHSFTADDHRFDTRMQPGDDTSLVLTELGKVAFHDVDAPAHTGALTVTAR